MARTDIAQALGLERGASDLEMIAAATQLAATSTSLAERRVFETAPWLEEIIEGEKKADGVRMDVIYALGFTTETDAVTKAQIIQRIEELFEYIDGAPSQLAAVVFRAKVAERVKAGKTVEQAQREVASEEPGLFAAGRVTPANDDASRTLATSMFRAAAGSIAKREHVDLAEAQRRAVTDYPDMYAASRGGGR